MTVLQGVEPIPRSPVLTQIETGVVEMEDGSNAVCIELRTSSTELTVFFDPGTGFKIADAIREDSRKAKGDGIIVPPTHIPEDLLNDPQDHEPA